MRTIRDIKAQRGIGGPPMLHGSDLPKSVNHVDVVVRELREAPDNFRSPAILEFEKPVHGKECMAINITNLRALAALAGFSDIENAPFDDVAKRLKGKTIRFTVAMVNNPQTREFTRSLFVKSEGGKKRG
jgi:hypothetical protein